MPSTSSPTAPTALGTCSRTGWEMSSASPTRCAVSVRAAPRSTRRSSSRYWVAAAVTTSSAGLTERDREVLGLMAEGRSNQAIARRLVVTERTVEKHVTSVFDKLGLMPAPEDHRRVLAVLTFLRSQ